MECELLTLGVYILSSKLACEMQHSAMHPNVKRCESRTDLSESSNSLEAVYQVRNAPGL